MKKIKINNKILSYIFMIIGIFCLILGLFDLQETRFGYHSNLSLFGVMLMGFSYCFMKFHKIEEGK